MLLQQQQQQWLQTEQTTVESRDSLAAVTGIASTLVLANFGQNAN